MNRSKPQTRPATGTDDASLTGTQRPRHTSHRRGPLLLVAIAALALVLGACGSTDEVVAGADGDDQEQSQDQAADDGDGDGAMAGDYQLTESRPEMISAQTAPIHSVEAIDETTLAVRYQNGSEPCSAANVTITETDTSVTVLLETGLDPNAAAMSCIAQVIDYEIHASLSEALGNRELIVEGP